MSTPKSLGRTVYGVAIGCLLASAALHAFSKPMVSVLLSAGAVVMFLVYDLVKEKL